MNSRTFILYSLSVFVATGFLFCGCAQEIGGVYDGDEMMAHEQQRDDSSVEPADGADIAPEKPALLPTSENGPVIIKNAPASAQSIASSASAVANIAPADKPVIMTSATAAPEPTLAPVIQPVYIADSMPAQAVITPSPVVTPTPAPVPTNTPLSVAPASPSTTIESRKIFGIDLSSLVSHATSVITGNTTPSAPAPTLAPIIGTTPAPVIGNTSSMSSYICGTGEPMSFTTHTLSGAAIDSATLFAQANITVLNVWGTFCVPCISEMPALGRLDDNYKSQGVQVVGIVSDVYENQSHLVGEANEIAARTGADYTHIVVSDSVRSTAMSGVVAVPYTMFLDSQGRCLYSPQVGQKSYEAWASIIDGILRDGASAQNQAQYEASGYCVGPG